MGKMKGVQSLAFENPVYINAAASIVGQLEGEGPLGKCFDRIEADPMMGQDSWEEAESYMQLRAAKMALEKAKLQPEDIRMIFAGDLLAQSIASSSGLWSWNGRSTGCLGRVLPSGRRWPSAPWL